MAGAALALLLFTAPAASAEATRDLVAKLQASYDTITTIEASFKQTYRSRRFDDKVTEGRVVFSKPGKMRWDYSKPKGRVLVADGKTMTLYDPDDRQALETAVPASGDLPVPLSFLWGKQRIDEAFDVTPVAEKDGEARLRLRPKRSIPNVSEVTLTLRLTAPVVITRTQVQDELGGESDIAFSGIRTNVPVPDGRFAFEIPKGVSRVPISLGEARPGQK
jgi:outer membrane lipoprotein carrier protein